MASCKRALGIAKQGGTAGISILWPVLDVFEDGSFYLSSLPPLLREGDRRIIIKCLPFKGEGDRRRRWRGLSVEVKRC